MTYLVLQQKSSRELVVAKRQKEAQKEKERQERELENKLAYKKIEGQEIATGLLSVCWEQKFPQNVPNVALG